MGAAALQNLQAIPRKVPLGATLATA